MFHSECRVQAARRASLAQGAGLLRAAQAMFPLGEDSGGMISEFRALVRGGSAAFSQGSVSVHRADVYVLINTHSRIEIRCVKLGLFECSCAEGMVLSRVVLILNDLFEAATSCRRF